MCTSWLLNWTHTYCIVSRPGSLDVVFVDFDNVRFHLSTPEKKTVLVLSMNIRCWDELVQYGALDVLRREYGSLVAGYVEPDYNVSLEIDLEQAPTDAGNLRSTPIWTWSLCLKYIAESREAFATSLSLLKRNALAAPFERGFTTQKQLENSTGQGDLMQIHYRDEEAMYVQAAPDRVTVIFSTVFQEETDRIFGKVFLQVRLTPIYRLDLSAADWALISGICWRASSTVDSECSSSAVLEPRPAVGNPTCPWSP